MVKIPLGLTADRAKSRCQGFEYLNPDSGFSPCQRLYEKVNFNKTTYMQEIIHLEPGKFYHIYNRGINGENLFKEERNYDYFLEQYTKYVSPVVDTYAYCLLKNHFHLLVRIKDFEDPKENLKELMESQK